MPETSTIEVREDLSYPRQPMVNVITDIEKVMTMGIKNSWIETLMDYLVKGNSPESTMDLKSETKGKKLPDHQ